MAEVKRVVSTSFWNDDKVVDSFTPEDKYFMLYLLTNPHTKQIGIYQLNAKIAAFETGYSQESVMCLLERFEKFHKIIKRSSTTSEIAIKNYLCYSVVKGGTPVLNCLNSELQTIKDKSLLVYVIKHLETRNDLTETVISFINSLKEKSEIKKEIENVSENDNDNDNECTGSVQAQYGSRTEKKPKRHSERFVPPTLDEVKSYCSEINAKIDPEAFVDYYTQIGWVCGKAGKPMKDWKSAVRNWNRRESKNNKGAETNNEPGRDIAKHRLPTTAERYGWDDDEYDGLGEV